MQDGILKGTGNSRYLKSIADFLTQYPTYEDMVAALVAGTLPIDLNGINTAGWSQVPTYLNKANLLSASTETAIWGSSGNRTVDAALRQLDTLVGTAQSTANTANNKIVTGIYTGTGKSGSENQNSLTIGFTPNLVIIVGNGKYVAFLWKDGSAVFFESGSIGADSQALIVSEWGNTIKWYVDATNAPNLQMNNSNVTYTYTAFA